MHSLWPTNTAPQPWNRRRNFYDFFHAHNCLWKILMVLKPNIRCHLFWLLITSSYQNCPACWIKPQPLSSAIITLLRYEALKAWNVRIISEEPAWPNTNIMVLAFLANNYIKYTSSWNWLLDLTLDVQFIVLQMFLLVFTHLKVWFVAFVSAKNIWVLFRE